MCYRSVRAWLYATSGMVGATVLVGGATRLNNSGLSIVEWRPLTGVVPPLSETAWNEEFEKYKRYPEYLQNPITMQRFKFIYLFEWGHRNFGRLSGVMFFVPYCYFLARGKLPQQYRPLLHATLGGFALQGFVGWYMVQSGMDFKLLDDQKPATVSAYRLATHLSIALALFSSMTFVAFRLSPAKLTLGSPTAKRLTALAIACLSTSIVSGAAVAGLDAGMIYNDFPWMGEGIFPPAKEIAYYTPHWRNIFENPSAAQVVHKVCACWTLASVLLLGVSLRRTPLKHMRHHLYVLSSGQVGLGIATLMSSVNVYLGVAHQGTAMALLTSLLYVLAAA